MNAKLLSWHFYSVDNKEQLKVPDQETDTIRVGLLEDYVEW